MCIRDRAESIKKWYDGYHFGAFDVYCPWDVMNYLLELQRNPKEMCIRDRKSSGMTAGSGRSVIIKDDRNLTIVTSSYQPDIRFTLWSAAFFL